MSKVNRSTYQKVVEENKRLLRDIKVLVNGSIPEVIFLKDKYQKRFKSEKELNDLLRYAAKKYVDDNPNDPVVMAVKEIGDKQKKLTQCMAGRDGECCHNKCPQILDNEPESTGRHCPLPFIDWRQ
ncbi:hypothetical protein [Aquimarina sp. 2201CG5-10]|uniref:hypothetical protein n=1 Tax=Aquimarina callyspongiae TaxID=3098150 RepID=UPI002AB46F88|nr:hypothetical protein [Aquimarina sp. 2201CG5-10]MDY8137586.1 hypothetical protein [Aquimarina sp. 2201CG5-10]